MHPREQKPEESKESAIIQGILRDNESTWRPFVSKSVGMAVLTLRKDYPGNIEAAHDQCVKELTAIKESKETPENLQNAIKYIIAITKEHVDPLLDVVKLFISKQEENYILPLKEVLPLVWMALHDHAKFAHHYYKNPDFKEYKNPEELQAAEETAKNAAEEAAKQDLPKRLENFFHCLKKMQAEPVCHHGSRNELVFLLNGTYVGIDIIEDEKTTVLAFLKDYINKLFWQKYKTSSEAERRTLSAALFKWMEDSEQAGQLLKQIDADANYRKQINELFVRHGSDPKAVKVLVDTALNYLYFSCDSKIYPAIAKVNEILNSDAEYRQDARNQALSIMQKWIKQQHDLNNPQFQDLVTSFHYLDKVRRNLSGRNRLLLELGGKINDELLESEKELNNYFVRFTQDNKEVIPKASPEMLQKVGKLDCAIQEVKKDTMVDQVENFFIHWFNAVSENNLERMKKQYAIFLLFEEKIPLTDDAINKLEESSISEENGTRFLDISQYQINRIFLHAILELNWSLSFLRVFKTTLNLVKNNFNKPESDLRAKALKRDSYRPALLSQLDYFLHSQDPESKPPKPPRPEKMLILPQKIGTFSDWKLVASLINEQQHQQFYRDHFNVISPILRTHWALSQEAFKAVINSIPFAKQKDFFSQYASLDLRNFVLENFNNLLFILDHRPWREAENFLMKIQLNFDSIIKNVNDLTGILDRIINKFSILDLLRKEMVDFNRIIKTAHDLLELIAALGPRQLLCKISFILHFVRIHRLKNLVDLITNEEDLINILNCDWDLDPVNSKKDFIKKLNVSALVKSTQGLKALLKAFGQDEVIQLIKEKKLDLTAIITDAKGLATVLEDFHEDNQMVFVKETEPHLPVIISNTNNLLEVLSRLSDKNRTRFIDEVNLNYAAIINDDITNLVAILKLLPASSRLDFVCKAGVDIQSKIINVNDGDNTILSLFTADEQAIILGEPADAKITELSHSANKLMNSYEHEADLKARLVGKPLYNIGDIVFQYFFYYVFGFGSIIKLLNHLNLPKTEYFLPDIQYKLSYHHLPFLASISISKFTIDSAYYEVNIFSKWFTPLNFIARHLGKFLGWILVSPFTIIAYLLIKAYYGIKQVIINFKINSNPQELASIYCKNKYRFAISADRVAKHVSATDFMVGFVKHHRENLSLNIDLSPTKRFELLIIPDAIDDSLLGRYKDYSNARKKVLVRQRYWSLAKTILSGIFLLPLLFTIPAHNKLVQLIENEKKLLQENGRLLEKISQPLEQMKEKSYFEVGKLFSYHQRPDLAFYYFTKVSKLSPMYSEAMECCGKYLESQGGNPALAKEYFKKAQDARVVNAAKRQVPLAVVATGSMPAEVKEDKSEDNFVAVTRSAHVLRRVGVFADQSISASNSDDDAEDDLLLRPRA